MSLDLLRTFVVAADAPSFAVAAQKRHVTKSAISQQIKALEASLGMPLFERVGRNVRPTASARALADALRRAFALVDDAVEAARDVHGSVRGEVRIGAPRPFTRAILRPRIARLLERYPDLVLDVAFGTPTELETKLLAGDLDIAVLVRPPEADSIDAEPLFVESFEAVASPEYVARHGRPRTSEDFDGHRFVVFDRDLPMHAAWWRATFGRAAMRGAVVCRVASVDEMIALAEEGIGIAVVADYLVRDEIAGGRLVHVRPRGEGRRAKSTILLARRRGAVASARVDAVGAALLDAESH